MSFAVETTCNPLETHSAIFKEPTIGRTVYPFSLGRFLAGRVTLSPYGSMPSPGSNASELARARQIQAAALTSSDSDVLFATLPSLEETLPARRRSPGSSASEQAQARWYQAAALAHMHARSGQSDGPYDTAPASRERSSAGILFSGSFVSSDAQALQSWPTGQETATSLDRSSVAAGYWT